MMLRVTRSCHRRLVRPAAAGLGIAAVTLALACQSGEPKNDAATTKMESSGAPTVDRQALRKRAEAVLGILPGRAPTPDNPITEEKVALGRALYYDERLSIAQDISCNSCHQLDNFGVDNEPTSPGHRGQRGDRNSPTVYNAALHIAQFWDGRAEDVEEQAKGPVLNPVEMGMPSEDYVLEVLHSIPGYGEMFAAAFPGEEDPITYDNFGKAVGAFERLLMTPAPFDAFLEGRTAALTDEQAHGLQVFLDTGCTACHMGPTVGGTMYQKLGLVRPYPTADIGRAKVTGRESDEYFFKVPSLRNVAQTHPYFHDGSVATLDEAIRLMGAHQLGRDLGPEDVAAIRAFLESLTGTIEASLIARPELPASGPDTPGGGAS